MTETQNLLKNPDTRDREGTERNETGQRLNDNQKKETNEYV